MGGHLRQRRLAGQSLELLKELAAREPRYKVLSFARNFGHQMAITAGIDRADGDGGGGDGRRPARPARGRQGDGREVARGLRRRLRRALAAARRDLVQEADRGRVLPAAARDAGRRFDSGRRRRLSADEPAGGADAARAARAAPVRARHGGLGRLPPDRGDLRAPGALRRRDQVPAAQDAALRDRRHHVLLERPAALRDLAGRARRAGRVIGGVWAVYEKIFGTATFPAGRRS